MSALATALHAFVSEHRAGGGAALEEHLARAPRGMRPALAEAIDSYLVESAREEFTRSAYLDSSAPELVASLSSSLEALDRPGSG